MNEESEKLIMDFVKGYYKNLGYTIVDLNNKTWQKVLRVSVSKNQYYVFNGYHEYFISFDFSDKMIVVLDMTEKNETTFTISEFMTTICDLLLSVYIN
jgi:hypothetical protein|nr:MAG TPA: hypothetical protein [Caudoviricetes sp.]